MRYQLVAEVSRAAEKDNTSRILHSYLSIVNQLSQDNLIYPVSNVVHPSYPFHLILRFQCFCHILFLSNLRGQLVKVVIGSFIYFCQMVIQFALQEQFAVCPGTVFFQVFPSHPAVLADLHRLFRFKNEIREKVVAFPMVSQIHYSRLQYTLYHDKAIIEVR